MPSVKRFARPIALAACIGGALIACGSDPGSSPDERVAETSQAATVCPKGIACCVGSPVALSTTDPFQEQLTAWGCTMVKPYTPNQSENAWWFVADCTDPGARIESFLKSNPKYTAAPYYASVSTSLAQPCAPPPATGSVHVLWDPTCATCKSSG
jgi:hypothetical protein